MLSAVFFKTPHDEFNDWEKLSKPLPARIVSENPSKKKEKAKCY